MNDTRLRERDEELFRLVNTLKASRVVYRKTSPSLYDALVARRTEIDPELETDDCYMKIVSDRDFLFLSFYPDDADYQNRLRKKLTVSEMKFYISLLQLYTERYVSSGDYVSVGTEEIFSVWDQFGFNTKSSQLNKRSMEPLVKTMKRHGILADAGDEQYLIMPGILFGLDQSAFLAYYDAVLSPWFAGREGPEEIAEGVTEDEEKEEV